MFIFEAKQIYYLATKLSFMPDSTNFESRSGRSFYADNLAVIFKENTIYLDFKKNAPRLDRVKGEKRQTVVSEHNPVITSPKKAKMFKKVLERNIERYEEKFGEIEINTREQEESEDTEEETTDYIA